MSLSLGNESGIVLYRNQRGDHRYGKAKGAGEMPKSGGRHEAARRYTRGL